MAASVIDGQHSWNVKLDEKGHRDYTITFKIRCLKTDGPYALLSAAGAPTIGSWWYFDGDADPWAFCTPETMFEPALEGEPNTIWLATYYFTTRPQSRCQDQSITDPMLEPYQISGSFVRKQLVLRTNRAGAVIRQPNFETVKGLTSDASNATVTISANVWALNLPIWTAQLNSVNDATLWGMAVDCVKFSGASWERKLYGLCNLYYTLKFEFEINPETHAIRDVVQQGIKVRKGAWNNAAPPVWVPDVNANKNNPASFEPFKNHLNQIVTTETLLDDQGDPDQRVGFEPETLPAIHPYSRSNLLRLGIPSTL